MSVEPEPSDELKAIIWDVVARVGKGNWDAVRKALAGEIERRGDESGVVGHLPEIGVIRRIVEEDLNELPQDRAFSTLPPHVWALRADYEELKGRARDSGAAAGAAGPAAGQAGQEHLEEIRGLIADWTSHLKTPAIDEVTLESTDSTRPMRDSPLYGSLKEHLALPSLWVDYAVWQDRFDLYLDDCKHLWRAVRNSQAMDEHAGKDEEGNQVWRNTKDYPYELPVLRRISQEAVGEKARPHVFGRRPWYLDEYGEWHQGYPEKREELGELVRCDLLYADGVAVGLCAGSDTRSAQRTYQDFSDYHLAHEDAREVMVRYREVRTLETALRPLLQRVLARRDYLSRPCAVCAAESGGTLGGQIGEGRPTWATRSAYERELARHFDALNEANRGILANMEALLHHQKKRRGKHEDGRTEMEGDIVAGGSLGGRTLLRMPFRQGQLEAVDSLHARCLFAHFTARFPEMGYYEDWRGVNPDNVRVDAVRKLRSCAGGKDFGVTSSCPVCLALRRLFDVRD